MVIVERAFGPINALAYSMMAAAELPDLYLGYFVEMNPVTGNYKFTCLQKIL